MNRVTFSALRLRSRPGNRAQGWLTAGSLAIPVALGRSGVMANKREGDGGTPRGDFRLVRLWWRPDRAPRPRTRLPVRPIRGDDGWCEDPRDRHYNQPIRLSPDHAGDRLKRADHLYDLIVELDDRLPRGRGAGKLERYDHFLTGWSAHTTTASATRRVGRGAPW